MPEDRLAHIFALQAKFDGLLADRRDLDFDLSTWLQKGVLAMISELSEILDEAQFKWWKDPQPINSEKLTEELVDVLHFYISMCIKAGIGPEDLYQAYVAKNKENFDRQEGKSRPGYAWDSH